MQDLVNHDRRVQGGVGLTQIQMKTENTERILRNAAPVDTYTRDEYKKRADKAGCSQSSQWLARL
jgi:hypothetical protein